MAFDFSCEPGKKKIERNLVKTEKPLLSIITPYYNAGEYFEQTYNCVMNQTFPFFEWIIVNDGSTDENDIKRLEQFVNKDLRIKLYHQVNSGPSIARNVAITKATTEIIVILDADDLIVPTYIEYLYWSLYFNEEATWSYTDCVGFGTEQYKWRKNFSADRMKVENLLTCSAAIKKDAILSVGGYSEEKYNHEDWQLWLRLLGEGKFPVHVNDFGFWYRRSTQGVCYAVNNDHQRIQEVNSTVIALGKKVDTNITAVEFPRLSKSNTYDKPYCIEWSKSIFEHKTKKNILMLLPWLELGGADLFNLDLVSRMDKEKYEMSIITTVACPNTWKQRFEEYTSEIFDLTAFLDLKDWSAFVHYFIKSREIDVIFLSNSYYGYYLVPWLRKEFPEIAIVDYVHMEEWYWRRGGYARTSVALDDILDKTYVCNERTRQVMINEFGKPANKIETIYIGVDEKEYTNTYKKRDIVRCRYDISKERPIILFPCRVHPQKRPFLMIEIAEELRKQIKNIAFLVVGDGPQLDEVKETVRKRNLESTIYFAGRQNNMKDFYEACDLTLICSIKEGLALTAYESLAMEVPVVTADVGGQAELIDNTVGAVIPLMQDEETQLDSREFQQEEIQAYVNAIKRILEEEEKYLSICKSCREKIKSLFTKDIMINRFEHEFEKINELEKIKKRKEVANSTEYLNNIIEDYLVIYSEFEKKEMEADEIWRSKVYFEELARGNVINNSTGNWAIDELNNIYASRLWRIMQRLKKLAYKIKIAELLKRILG